MRMLPMAAAMIAMIGGSVSAGPNPQRGASQPPDPGRTICRRLPDTQHLPGKRICKTEAAWRGQAQEAVDSTQRLLDKGMITSCSMGGC